MTLTLARCVTLTLARSDTSQVCDTMQVCQIPPCSTDSTCEVSHTWLTVFRVDPPAVKAAHKL